MELNERHIQVLEKLLKHHNMALEYSTLSGSLGKQYLKGFESEVSHLIERGFIQSHTERMIITQYRITDSGIKELERLNAPPDEGELLKQDITRLETALAAAKERLAALNAEKGNDMKGARVWNK